MKRNLLFAISAGFLTNAFVFAQSTPVSTTVANKNVLLEELTGIHCGYCPDGHAVANGIATAHPGRVVLVNIHAGSFASAGTGEPNLKTTDGDLIDTWMSCAGYPAGSVQRRGQAGELTTGRSSWSGIATPIFSEASPVNIAMDASIDVATRILTLHVEMYYTTPQTVGTTHRLNIGMLQDNFESIQSNYGNYNPTAILPNGNYLHQHIFRGFINAGGTWGESIDATQVGVITKTVTYTIPAAINLVNLDIANLKFFAFIGEGHNTATNSNVFTCAEVTPTLTNVPAPTASASSIVNNLRVACTVPASVTPVVKVLNGGTAITAITFSTTVNGGTPSIYNWTGTISALGSLEIPITGITAFTPSASNSVVVTITSVNGGAGSIGTASTTKTFAYAVPLNAAAAPIIIQINTDQYGSETTWTLKNGAGTVVASGGPYTDGTTAAVVAQAPVTYTAPTAGDCYEMTVNDKYGDGMSPGNYTVKDGSDNTLVSGGTFTKIQITNFVSGAGVGTGGIDELGNSVFKVYPNPATENVNVSFTALDADYSISILDLTGRTVVSNNYTNLSGNQVISIPVSGLTTGNYIVKITSAGVTVNQKVSIK